MVLNNIVLVSLYSPGDENVGYRRMLFFANAFAERGYRVFFVTIKEPIFAGEEIDPKITFIFSRHRRKRLQKNLLPNWSAKVFSTLKKLVSKKVVGQLPDPRLLSIFSFMSSVQKSELSLIDKSKTLLIGSHPPWSALLFTRLMARKFGFDYCLDFRDLFYGSHLFADNFGWLEKVVQNWLCSNARLLTTVSRPWLDCFDHPNLKMVPNGYVGRYFEHPIKSFDPEVRYFGSITFADRVNRELYLTISSNSDRIFEFYGDVSLIRDELSKFPNVRILGHVEYDKAISLMRRSHANILIGFEAEDISRRGMIQTKLYEYMAAKRPIYYIGPRDVPSFNFVEPSGLVVKNINFDLGYIPSCNKKYIESWNRQNSFEVFLNAIKNI
jgi:hypothetical protein